MRGKHSLALLWSGADLAVRGFLGNWAGFILLVILSLSLVRIKFSLNCAFYEGILGEPFFYIYKPLSFAGTLSPFFFSSWTKNAAWILDVVAGAKEAESKDFPTFQPARKKTFLLQPGTAGGIDCVRPSMSPQTLIKNVQELAQEEGEESEAKLREAIEILEGATFATTSS